jgi:hypothetical protein
MNTKIALSIALCASLLALSCQEKSPKKVKQEGAVTENMGATIAGEYYYSAEGAVLKGGSFIYAVAMDDMAKELGDRVAEVKKDVYDMVPVMVRGTVSRNPALDQGQEVWEQMITIKEIVSVGDQPAKVDIKIQDQKKTDVSN